MGTYLHRTTKAYLQSIPPHELPEPLANYIENPDLSNVVGVPTRYWTITGDVITEMSQAEKDAVDAALLQAARDAVADQIDQVEDIIRALALTLLDELNNHSLKINAILDAADNAGNLVGFKASMLAIADYPQRTIEQLKTTIRNKLGS